MAVAVAIISKENYPLYVKTNSPGSDLKFLYTMHTSLDVIEEKVVTVNKSVGDLRELYLGLLYPTEDYKVYGYVTNTKIKFVVIVESSHTTLRDNEIRQMFRKIHAAYADMVCNPFYVPGETISSKSFESIIKSIMTPE
ncbi:trafficking protein particle complex subunit 2-like protein [Uloborus diversus]|uniref:trafficking protein particle complex subunit 2-like protein n=1 Tax=Uloborus diversus TaxID=327109 RepID=UPI002409B13F|nr:trafficking protein particle complex subunit 2-like protein [Uloborus diversus]